jgi:pimeloyl-ACP methyl ester carboxylesterase
MKLRSKVFGSGTPVVFLHGMGSSSSVWKPIVKEIRATNQCVLFDFPGHGDTPFNEWDPLTPEDMATIIINGIDSLGIDKFHLVGHSLGGWVGLEIAALYPERILSFTAISPGGLWRHKNTYEYPPMWALKLMHIILPPIAPIIPRIKKLKKIAFSSAVYRWDRITHAMAVDAIRSFSIACNSWYKSKRIDNFQVQADILADGFTKTIDPNVKMTVIFGRRDMSFTRPKFQDQSLVPSTAKWLSWPDSGHVPMWDNLDKVIDEIKLNIYGQNEAQ